MKRAVAACLILAACGETQGIEPILSPPGVYQQGTKVSVEFVHPARVGLRCAERGAKFLGLPAINSGACADRHLMTLPNPCYSTQTGGWYARLVCHELAHVNGWPADHTGGTLRRQTPIRPASESPAAKGEPN